MRVRNLEYNYGKAIISSEHFSKYGLNENDYAMVRCRTYKS